MPTLTIVLPETLAERLRRTVREQHGGKKGAISQIISEALDSYLNRSQPSTETELFQAYKADKKVAEASSLPELARKLRENEMSPRSLRIISTRKLAPIAKAGYRTKPT